MSRDARGWRVALVADALVNPPPSSPRPVADVLKILATSGFGVLQLPPPGEHRLLLAVIADQVAEYAHHGYAVMAVGVSGVPENGLHWRRLAPLLRHRGVALPARHVIRGDAEASAATQELAAALSGFDIPENEQRHWRV
jgi:hypothetical protein